MTSRDFCFWLQGHMELQVAPEGLTPVQVEVVRKHLALVFTHEIDPSMGDATHQAALNAIHAGDPKPPADPSPSPIVVHHHHDHNPVMRC